MLRRRVCKGATRTARCSAPCCRLRASESPLLKTTLQPTHHARHGGQLEPRFVAGAAGRQRAMVDARPAPKHRDFSVYVLGCRHAMPRKVPGADFIRNSRIAQLRPASEQIPGLGFAYLASRPKSICTCNQRHGRANLRRRPIRAPREVFLDECHHHDSTKKVPLLCS